jgi:D-serine deaminase-like pyridoxal phosphate-dependent protein
MDAWERWKHVLAAERLPAAVVDMDAVDRNAARLLAAMGQAPVTMRLASKSVRVPGVLKHLLGIDPRIRGILAFSAYEAALLADRGFDDLVVAYPIARADEADAIARTTARGFRVAQVVDDIAQIPLLAEAGKRAGTVIGVCLDVDASWRPAGTHVGVRRSPIRDAAAAVRVANAAREAGHLRVDAVMAYEAQVAGMRDINPGSRALDPIRRWIKARSRPAVATLRRQVVAALREAGHEIRIVNGGGTGSIATTAADGSVTEVTAGSGFFCSHLFDGYLGLDLEPAAFFAIAVVRRSDPDHVTCMGGGIVASGEAGPSRLPVVHLPEGLVPLGLEGFGEVQTPFKVVRGPAPRLGDPVLCRPAKAGEWLERFTEVLLVRGDAIVAREPTYRGLGACFG